MLDPLQRSNIINCHFIPTALRQPCSGESWGEIDALVTCPRISHLGQDKKKNKNICYLLLQVVVYITGEPGNYTNTWDCAP